MDERFGKRYKLSSKKLIQQVFTEGEKVNKLTLLLRFIKTNEDLPAPFQIAISVPKRNFKHAVDRNRIKRMIVEAVRKNKHIIEEKNTHSDSTLVLFLIFSDKKMPNYNLLFASVESLFQKLPTHKDND